MTLCLFYRIVVDIVGKERAQEIGKAAISLYVKAAEHAKSRGILLADTKFEFGLIPAKGTPVTASSSAGQTLILVDEVLTPDSSRFWDAEAYEPGKPQGSFDKQYVRDWLKSQGLDKAADQGVKVTLPPEVVQKTSEKYREAYERITGKTWSR